MTTIETSVPGYIQYTSLIFSSISLLGAAYIALSSLFHKRLRTFSFRMIIWMCIFDFMLGCATICGPLGTIEEEAGIENESGEVIINDNINIGNSYESSLPLTCKLQAAAIQFSILSALLWTLCFAIHLFRITRINVNPNCTHSYASFFMYIFITIPIPAFLTYYIFAQNIVGVSSDFWCWIKEEFLDEWAWKMLYIEIGVMVIILFLLYFVMKFHLKKFIEDSSIDLNNNNLNDNVFGLNLNDNSNVLILNRSRLAFVRTISGGLSSYLFAPFIAFIPAHFNMICTVLGLEWDIHVLSWYVLSGVLLGVLHIGIYICGISLVRYSWSSVVFGCCNNEDSIDKQPQNVNNDNNRLAHNIHYNNNYQRSEDMKRTLQQSQKHYMELV